LFLIIHTIIIFFTDFLFYPSSNHHHPPYKGRWDQFCNKLLPKGECIVCKHKNSRVLKLMCGHQMCLGCLKGYLQSALGDASKFPVKCPMHYDGCSGQVDSLIAKRVLKQEDYYRFNDFSDRALYGEGIIRLSFHHFTFYIL